MWDCPSTRSTCAWIWALRMPSSFSMRSSKPSGGQVAAERLPVRARDTLLKGSLYTVMHFSGRQYQRGWTPPRYWEHKTQPKNWQKKCQKRDTQSIRWKKKELFGENTIKQNILSILIGIRKDHLRLRGEFLDNGQR